MPLTGNFGYGAGAGHPDAMTGHGYSSIKGGPGNRTYPMQRGFPYDELDLMPDEEDDKEDEFEESDDELAVKVSQRNSLGSYHANDHMGMHARDRRSNVDSSSYSIAFAEQHRRLREMSSGIRLRSRSSEPDSGTIYGWSSPPMWDEPRRFAGVKRPRLKDIIGNDDEEDFDEDAERLSLDVQEEQILRHFISTTLHEVIT